MNQAGIAIVCIALSLAAPLAAEGEKRLKTEFQDLEPKFVLVDGVPSGIAYEIMRYVERKSGYTFDYSMKTVPITRVITNLESGEKDIQFGLHRTPARARGIVYGAALYQVKTIGVVRKGEYGPTVSIADIVARHDTVLTPHGTAIASSLKTISGLTLDDGAWSVEANFQKLAEGRGSILVYHDLTIKYSLGVSGYRDGLSVVEIDFPDGFSWTSVNQYIAFSRKVPESVMNEINGVIEAARANGELEAITGKYFH